jgi:hypothetical protein
MLQCVDLALYYIFQSTCSFDFVHFSSLHCKITYYMFRPNWYLQVYKFYLQFGPTSQLLLPLVLFRLAMFCRDARVQFYGFLCRICSCSGVRRFLMRLFAASDAHCLVIGHCVTRLYITYYICKIFSWKDLLQINSYYTCLSLEFLATGSLERSRRDSMFCLRK